MSQETPKPINQFLQQSESGKNLEDINSFNDLEWLGLDEPRFEIVSRGQSEVFPRIVKFIVERKIEDAAATILPHFGLNEGIFDEVKSPRGIFRAFPKPQNKHAVLLSALLNCSGVRRQDIRSMFTQTEKVTSHLSDAWSNKLQELNHKREMFAIDHLDDPKFAKIKELFADDKRREWKYKAGEIH